MILAGGLTSTSSCIFFFFFFFFWSKKHDPRQMHFKMDHNFKFHINVRFDQTSKCKKKGRSFAENSLFDRFQHLLHF